MVNWDFEQSIFKQVLQQTWQKRIQIIGYLYRISIGYQHILFCRKLAISTNVTMNSTLKSGKDATDRLYLFKYDQKIPPPPNFQIIIIQISHFQNIVGNSGVILETEGSIRKIQKGQFFTTKKFKRAPLIWPPYVHSIFPVYNNCFDKTNFWKN